MCKNYIVIVHFSRHPDFDLASKANNLKNSLQPLGRFYPAFVHDHCVALVLKTDEHAAIISKHLQRHTLCDADKSQVFELGTDMALRGFSQLQVWL